MSSSAISTAAPAPTPTIPFSRLARAYGRESRAEALRALRQPAFAGPLLALPAALYLLFVVVLFAKAIQKEPHAPAFLLAGFTVLGVMGPGLFAGIFVSNEREQGALALRRALPVPMAAYVTGKAFLSAFFSGLVVVAMALAGGVGHAGVGAGGYALLFPLAVLGSLPFSALGLFIGSWATAKSAPGFANLLYLPMIYLSGFLFPLPAGIRWIARLSPAFHLDQLMLRAVGVPVTGSVAPNVLFLVAATALFGGLAVRRLTRVG